MPLALPSCDKCGHRWHARYRRKRPVMFYCPRCSRRHPRWTAGDIAEIARMADEVMAKMSGLNQDNG